MPSFFEGVCRSWCRSTVCRFAMCFFSKNVPKEVKFGKKTEFIDINAPITTWIETIEKNRKSDRKLGASELENSPYNIKQAHLVLEKYYLDMMHREEQ